MSYISYADQQWWADEKLDDEQDMADMGGDEEVQAIPAPNRDVDTYDNRYGSFSTRFGNPEAGERKENNSPDDPDPPHQSPRSPLRHLKVYHIVAAVLLATVMVFILKYLSNRRRITKVNHNR
tara:strand:- start:5296 stop:5664 length:369 start_codon:yes stop_codon:yes gene_type:complete